MKASDNMRGIDRLFEAMQSNSWVRLLIFSTITLFMGNLNALVDLFLHPEIPYFDQEHLIVGIIFALFCVFFFSLLTSYLRHLGKAKVKIEVLESFLSICSYCKRIRIPHESDIAQDSWQQLETYISNKTLTVFSHGMCPDCFKKMDFAGRLDHSPVDEERIIKTLQ